MKDETYIGHTIHYRETNISFKNKRRVRKPQSEWVRVENTQEPIISEQVFRQVQEQIANRRRKCKDGTTPVSYTHLYAHDDVPSICYQQHRNKGFENPLEENPSVEIVQIVFLNYKLD